MTVPVRVPPTARNGAHTERTLTAPFPERSGTVRNTQQARRSRSRLSGGQDCEIDLVCELITQPLQGLRVEAFGEPQVFPLPAFGNVCGLQPHLLPELPA